MYTPWGASQGQYQLAKGITQYSTAGHGGINLSDERIAEMSSEVQNYIKRNNFLKDIRWYEEDCDWAIVAIVFENDIRNNLTHNKKAAQRAGIRNHDDIQFFFDCASKTLTNYHPGLVEILCKAANDEMSDVMMMCEYRDF